MDREYTWSLAGEGDRLTIYVARESWNPDLLGSIIQEIVSETLLPDALEIRHIEIELSGTAKG